MAILFFVSDYHGGYGDFLFNLKLASGLKNRLKNDFSIDEDFYIVTQESGKDKVRQLEGDLEFELPILSIEEINRLQNNKEIEINYYFEGPVFYPTLHTKDRGSLNLPNNIPVVLIPEYGKASKKTSFWEPNPAQDLESTYDYLNNPMREEICVLHTGFRNAPSELGILITESLRPLLDKKSTFLYQSLNPYLAYKLTPSKNREISLEYSSCTNKALFNGGWRRFIDIHLQYILGAEQVDKDQDIVSVGKEPGCFFVLGDKPHILDDNESNLFGDFGENAIELLDNQLNIYFDFDKKCLAYIGKTKKSEVVEGLINEEELGADYYQTILSQLRTGTRTSYHLQSQNPNKVQSALKAVSSITSKRNHSDHSDEKKLHLLSIVNLLKSSPYNFERILYIDLDEQREDILFSSSNLSESPKTYRLLVTERLPHKEMIELQAISGNLVGTTGDQSFSESLSAGKLIIYECLPHKHRFAQSYIDLVHELTNDDEVKDLASLLLMGKPSLEQLKYRDYFINKQHVVKKLIETAIVISQDYNLVNNIFEHIKQSLLFNIRRNHDNKQKFKPELTPNESTERKDLSSLLISMLIKTTKLIDKMQNLSSDHKKELINIFEHMKDDYKTERADAEMEIIHNVKGLIILLKNKCDDDRIVSKFHSILFNIGGLMQQNRYFKNQNFILDDWLKSLNPPIIDLLNTIGLLENLNHSLQYNSVKQENR